MRAIGDIDDAYLAEADPAQTLSAPRRRAFHPARWGALAAGVCLLLLLPLVWRFVGRGGLTAEQDVSFAPAADGFRDGEALSGAQPTETAAAAALTTAPTTTAAASETADAPSTTVFYPEATGAPTTTLAPTTTTVPTTTTAPVTTAAPTATDAPVTTTVPTYYAPPAVGTYVWEAPEGEGMKSAVTLTEDGRFTFLFPAEGGSAGTGSCSLAEDVLTLTAIDGRVWYFAVEEGALRYLAHASDKSVTASLPDDARFILQ